MPYLVVLSESCDPITLILFVLSFGQDGCQFNMSTNVYSFLLSRLFLKAGAKIENLFQNGKCFLKFFLENFFSFFLHLFTNLSMNFPCFAGCKCKSFFRIPQAFRNLFFRIFFRFNRLACQYFSERLSLLRVQK